MAETNYKLEELAAAAGVSPRTVRYYVQRGLLSAPVFRGRDTAYDDDHLLRLRAIKRLQERFVSLDAIQTELEQRSREELEEVAAGLDKPAVGPLPGMAPAPLPFPGMPWLRGGSPPAGERFVRYVLRPGLELHLSEGADAAARALCEKILKAEVDE
jgi:Ca-activated chloride channel family protein